MDKDRQEFRVALIFPPAVHPTSPPLGIAALGAYLRNRSLQDRDSGLSVRLFDLNLAYFNQALRWMEAGRLRMSLRKWDHEATARSVIETCRFLRGEAGLEQFTDLPVYNWHASLYRDFGAVLNGLFDSFARKVLSGRPVPPLVERFFAELIAPVREFAPDLAGFSLLFSQQIYFALGLASRLKQDGIPVMLGGATLSVMPEPERLLSDRLVVQEGGGKNSEISLEAIVDYLLVGESETGLAGFVRGRGRELSAIPGLVYRRNGSVICNPPDVPADVNGFPPPDFSDFNLPEYHSPVPILPYLGSRGCFWQRCAFCTHRKTYLAYREEDVERTAENLAVLYKRHNARHFNLVDEMIHPHRFAALSRSLVRMGMDVNYSAYAKPVAGFSRPVLERLYASGARVVMWGVESGSQRVLDLMRKGTRVDDMETVLRDAHEAGVRNLVFMMFGFPSETREEWEASLEFLRRNGEYIGALSKSRFILLKGSEVFRHPEDFGISRVLPRAGRDPISVAYDYEAATGLSQAEARDLFVENLPELQRHGGSPHFGMFRDHFLVHASAAPATPPPRAGLPP